MPRLAVSVFGLDRPGIVAAVTRALADEGGNLEDSSMTILRGHFAMMLVVGGPGVDQVERALEPVAASLDLQVSVRPIEDQVTSAGTSGERWVLAVYGADRPGLVARVAEVLAKHQVNITDLESRVIGEPDPVYAMHFEVEVPPAVLDALRAALTAAAAELAVEISMHPDDADVL
jgi:glycine cleavage system transcriptional repressor